MYRTWAKLRLKGMKTKDSKALGVGLLLVGMIGGVGGSAIKMLDFYNHQYNADASTLAEGISASLWPAGFGLLFVIAGLVLLIGGWLAGRKATC